MESKIRFILLAVLASFGIYFLGDGMTGLVVASSDCTNCAVFSEINAMWGALMLLVVAIAIFAVYYHNRQ